MEKRVSLNIKLLKQEENLAKLRAKNVVKANLSPQEKQILFWTSKLGYTPKGTFKETKTWVSNGKEQTKEFEGVVMEKDGKEVKPLWVANGNVLRVWK
jgi:hypothetical protein